MGVYDFSIVKDKRLPGINNNLRIDPKPIPLALLEATRNSLQNQNKYVMRSSESVCHLRFYMNGKCFMTMYYKCRSIFSKEALRKSGMTIYSKCCM